MTSDERVNILLVDDRWENLLSLKAILESPDYNLVKASSGREALKQLLDRDFALILLDVQMPILNGFETAALIKSREKTRDIPIIFVSGVSTDDPFVFKGYGVGAVDYMCKPINPAILRSKVAVFADLYRKTRQIEAQARLLREAELKKLEMESLRREKAANEKYRDLVDGISNGIVWICEPETRAPIFLSPQIQTILGYPAENWQGNPLFWKTISHPEDQPAMRAELQKVLASKGDFSLEHRALTASGETIWLQTRARMVSVSDSGRYELRGLSVDISQLKETERALNDAIYSRDEFLSIASHELKTPLTPLKLQTQMLLKLCQQSNLLYPLEIVDRQASRLNRLVDELLDIARVKNGKLTLEPEELDMCELVQEVVQRYLSDLEKAGCRPELSLAAPVMGRWDRLRIEQVVVNLLSNSVRYAPGNPIRITLSSDGSSVKLSFKDEGPGIAKENQELVFQRFERVRTKAARNGLGLGLYIVKQIIDAHRGSIRLESDVDKGAHFIVELPLTPELETSSSGTCARICT